MTYTSIALESYTLATANNRSDTQLSAHFCNFLGLMFCRFFFSFVLFFMSYFPCQKGNPFLCLLFFFHLSRRSNHIGPESSVGTGDVLGLSEGQLHFFFNDDRDLPCFIENKRGFFFVSNSLSPKPSTMWCNLDSNYGYTDVWSLKRWRYDLNSLKKCLFMGKLFFVVTRDSKEKLPDVYQSVQSEGELWTVIQTMKSAWLLMKKPN